MPIRYDADAAILQGLCAIEEAEPLLAFLNAVPTARVDATGLDHAHTAVIQVLMALRPTVAHGFTDPVLVACLGAAPIAPPAEERQP
jgi:hypothetical protein